MKKTDFTEIKKLVIQNELNKAFELMYEIIEEHEELKDIHKTLIIRHSEYNEVQSNNRKGIIRYDDYQIVKRNILNVILDVADELKKFIEIKNEKEAKQKEKKIQTIQDEIEKRIEEKDDSNYVFIFGKAGVGKSTFLASLNNYILSNTELQLEFQHDTSNPNSIKYMKNAIQSIRTGELLRPNPVGEILEIDMSVRDLRSGEHTPITFLEMSGEESEKFSLSKEEYGYSPKVEEYLNSSRLYIMITSTKEAEKDDFAFYNFFENLKKQKREFKIGLFISKWDLIEREIDLAEFVQEKMPFTYQALNSKIAKSASVFSFGISTLQNPASNYYRETTNWLMKELKTTPNNG